MTLQEEVAGKAARLPAFARQIRDELRSNPRAAIGVVLAATLVAVFGALMFDDAVAASRARYVEQTHRLERLVASGEDKAWPSRAAASSELRQSLEARLWRGSTEGIVLAELQDWLMEQARTAGLTWIGVNLEVLKPKGFSADYRQITATITALDAEASLREFLDRLQREARFLVVDHLRVRERPVHSMEMKLVAYAIIEARRSHAQ